jgi:hypothetical protein
MMPPLTYFSTKRFLKFCFDCATTASLSANLVHLICDINGYPVLDIGIDYLGESFAGE